jgi:inner membrane transporter RhtA
MESGSSLRQTLIAVIALLCAMASVTSGAAIAKGLFAAIGAEGTTGMRNGLGALILLAVFRPWRAGRLDRRQALLVLVYGLNLGVMNLLYYCSLRTLPLGMAVAIEFLGPFSLALFHSRRAADLLWLAFAVTGLAMLLPWGSGSLAVDPAGAGFALAAGAAWALYIVFGQKAGAQLASGRVTSLGTAVAGMLTFPIGLAHAGDALFAGATFVAAAGVALFSSAIPYSLDMVAMKRLPTRTFGILMSIEPAVGALCGFVWLGEALTLRQQLAIACVIAASFGSTASASRALPVTPEN